VIEPDPAWDAAVETDGELVVEVTWLPNALAGRGDEFVASLALVDALTVAGITGFTTAGDRDHRQPLRRGCGQPVAGK